MGSKFTAAALLLVLTSALTMACSGGESFTAEEYAQLVCSRETGIAETWGDLAKDTQEGINAIEGINPPDEMRDYHNVLTALDAALIKLAKSKPQGEAINPFEMLGVPELQAGATLMENMPAETKQILAAAGCE